MVHLYKTWWEFDLGGVQIKYQIEISTSLPLLVRMMGNFVSAHWKEKTSIYFSIVTTKENNINILNKDVQSFLISKSYIYIEIQWKALIHPSRRWIICTNYTLSHCGIKCLTLYLDVSLYWVIGLSAIPHVPTPTLPFTLSGDANMLFFTCQNKIYTLVLHWNTVKS